MHLIRTLALTSLLIMSTTTHATQPFPAVDHVYTVDFGVMAFDLNFKSSSEMEFTGIKGAPAKPETVTYKVTNLRDGQYAVTWSDSTGKVTHIEDFTNERVDSFVVLNNGSQMHFQGTFKKK